MLAAGHRLTDPEGFRDASRRGRRAGSRTVTTHLLLPRERQVVGMSGAPGPRIGFVVSKAVGNAVTRNRVKRRLRHAAGRRLDLLPPGSLLVVRAQPAAAQAGWSRLAADLDHCLERCLGHGLERAPERPSPAGRAGACGSEPGSS